MPGVTADDLEAMEAEEEQEQKRREENKKPYKRPESTVSIIAKLKGLKCANAVKCGGEDKIYFDGTEKEAAPHDGYKIHLLSNNLVRIASRRRPLEPVFIPVMNCVYFVADDFNVSF